MEIGKVWMETEMGTGIDREEYEGGNETVGEDLPTRCICQN